MIDAPLQLGRSVWALTYAPTIWAAHFLVSYVTASVFCARAPDAGASLASVRMVIAIATLAALSLIGAVAWYAWTHWTRSGEAPLDPTPEGLGRARFLSFAVFLLAGVSALGTIYVALPALFITVCDG